MTVGGVRDTPPGTSSRTAGWGRNPTRRAAAGSPAGIEEVLPGRGVDTRGGLFGDGDGPHLGKRKRNVDRGDRFAPDVHVEGSAADRALSGPREPELVHASGPERWKSGHRELPPPPVGRDVQPGAR